MAIIILSSLRDKFVKAKLLCAVILIQSSYAGLAIITMFALNQGMSHYVFVSYRMAIATALIAPFAVVLDREKRPNLTFSTLGKIVLLSLFDPVLDQNLYYIGMKNTTATFTSAMSNMIPVFAFLMAFIFRFEKVNVRQVHGVAKLLGTIVTVGGAMLMTLIKGPLLNLPWTTRNNHHFQSQIAENQHHIIKGSLAVIASCFFWSCFIILQAHTLKTYPVQLSLTALISFFGLVEGTILALVVEWRNRTAWSIQLDMKTLAALYGGIISGVGYYIVGLVIKQKGPVYYTAFNPLTTIIVAVLASIVIAEKMYMGRLIGALIIIGGLYLVLWGKSRDSRTSRPRTEINANDEDTQEIRVCVT